MSLYLKYRSATFDDIVEQNYTKAILKQQVLKSFEGEQLSNYLFYGSRGIGKTSIARIMAKALNCLNNKDGNPCNNCEACKLIAENKAMDIVEIDAASHTGVDNIREEIIGKSIYPPVQLRKKVTIIDEVHMLSTGAFNALLKIMEEPPSYSVFILATTELHKVPETVISRCQVFNFKRISLGGIVSWLEHICKKEGFSYDIGGLEMIARIADGGMRDAVKYLDQVSILGIIDEKTVGQCLGVTSESVIQEFVIAYGVRDTKKLIEIVNRLQEDGVDIFVFLKELLSYVDRKVNTENVLALLSMAGFVKDCYEKLKYFPHPYVLMKSECYALGGQGPAHTVDSIEIVQGSKQGGGVAQQGHVEKTQGHESSLATKIEISGVSNPSQVVDITGSDGGDYEELKSRIIRNIGSASIKGIWESACQIESIKENVLTVQVIEKGKMILLTMTKNKQDMEKLCSEVLGKEIMLDYQYVDKEEFLRKGLGGLLA
ncbi:MAG TPA: DNA polymerase III subunit gamma/tau [Candidatus Absconditabacterales bacterium]|nr:DNA polymerase III subunit gamma/tau [Candidatus Absconditabacterales bacterium]